MVRKGFNVLGVVVLLLASVSVSTAQPTWVISGEERKPNSADSTGQSDQLTVRFTNGTAYRIPLYRARPISVLRGGDGTYFLLAAGADCTECDESTTLRFFMLGGDRLEGSGARYSYPGSLSDYESPRLLSKTRTFYGRCLGENGDVVVSFEEYLGDDEKWHEAASVVRLSKEGELLDRTPGVAMTAVTERAETAACTELPGIDGHIEP